MVDWRRTMMKKKNIIIALILSVLTTFVFAVSNSYSQTEGFNVKTSIEKIADSTTSFLKEITKYSKENPEKSISRDLVCNTQCFVVIPDIEVVESRGDFIGTGLMSCKNPSSNTFSEPLYYQINNLKSFEEDSGGLLVLVTNKEGMKSILGSYVHLDSDNSVPGPIGQKSDQEIKSFASYVMYKGQDLSGIDLSESELDYSSKDTFDAYQGTIVPIEIFLSPQDVPPMLRDFQSLLVDATKDCK